MYYNKLLYYEKYAPKCAYIIAYFAKKSNRNFFYRRETASQKSKNDKISAADGMLADRNRRRMRSGEILRQE